MHLIYNKPTVKLHGRWSTELEIKRYTDYSLRVLIYLGVDRERRATISEIADAFGVSRNHLVKVVHQLGAGDFVRTARGKGGGITLARAPEHIKLGEVVRYMEGNFEVINCNEPVCPILPACLLKGILKQASDSFLDVLDRYHLADLLGRPQQLRRRLKLTELAPAL